MGIMWKAINVCSVFLIGNQIIIKRDSFVKVLKSVLEHLLYVMYSTRAWGCNDRAEVDILSSHVSLLESTGEIRY